MMETPPRGFVSQPFSYHQELQLRIDALNNEGDGVGRVDGWVVFVPFALPGELVRARVYRNESNCSRADLVEVRECSPHRVKPLCPAFGTCGGCRYQHLNYDQQLEWKRRQVADLLSLQADIRIEVKPPVATDRQYAYRSKITPHFHKPKGAQVGAIGFLRVGSRSEVCDISQCPIAMDPINEALPRLRQQVRQSAAKYKRGATLLMRVSEGGEVLSNPQAVCTERVGNLTLSFLAGDFFQNNPYILPAFTDYVARRARGRGARFLVDAYCGSGLFALSLAKDFEEVTGVEVSASSADWARANASANGISHVRVLAAEADTVFAQITYPPQESVVVIDPPRKGCDKLFLDQLFRYGPQRVVYVSCNPATQVRDLVSFRQAGYEVTEVQPFDLFPQTKHLECVTTLDHTA